MAVGGLLLALPTSASAFKVRGGKAVITLAPAFRQSLTKKGVTVKPTGVASRTGNRLGFEIRRGGVKPKRRRASLRLRGGLRWDQVVVGDATLYSALRVIVRGQRGRITAFRGSITVENVMPPARRCSSSQRCGSTTRAAGSPR